MTDTVDYQLCLASASPRRAELLERIGLSALVYPVDIDESVLQAELPSDYVNRLAREKAEAGYRRHGQGLPTLGSDTAVVIDREILGKPKDKAHAVAMLQQLSGREHVVYTGVALVVDGFTRSLVQKSRVQFTTLTPQMCERYWETGEPCDKAGAYGIQGIGATFVREISGSFSGVMGLPLFETAELLSKANIPIMD